MCAGCDIVGGRTQFVLAPKGSDRQRGRHIRIQGAWPGKNAGPSFGGFIVVSRYIHHVGVGPNANTFAQIVFKAQTFTPAKRGHGMVAGRMQNVNFSHVARDSMVSRASP